jgi:hypothetical protein
VLLRDASVAVFGIPSRLGTGGLEVAPGEIDTGDGSTPAGSSGTGPPEAPAAPPSSNGATPALEPRTASGSMLDGAIALAVENCRALAGSRLIGRCSGSAGDAVRALVADVPKTLVAATLGQSRSRSLYPGKTALQLVSGGTVALAATLLDWGMPQKEAIGVCRIVEQHAAVTLWKERAGSPRDSA